MDKSVPDGEHGTAAADTGPTWALGIDIGTTNTKVALVRTEPAPGPEPASGPRAGKPGTTQSGEGASYPGEADAPTTAPTHYLHLESLVAAPTPTTASALIHTIQDAITTLLVDYPGDRYPLAAVGIASMAETGVPLDDQFQALCDLIPWSDTRAEPEGDELREQVPDLFAHTGVRPGPKPPLAKWMHLARHEPARWRSMATWAGTADLVGWALTGTLATDHTLAGRTGAWDLWQRSYRADLLARAGLAIDRLPPVLRPGQPVGLTAGGPLPPGVPVFIAGHDHAVGAHAAGVREPGQVADSLGTAEAIYGIVGEVSKDMAQVAAAGMSVARTVGADRLAMVGGQPAAGAAIAHLGRMLGAPALERAEGELSRRWRSGQPAAPGDVPIVQPYLHGRQTPEPDPAATLTVYGIGPQTDQAGLYDGLLCGLALQTRWMIAELIRLSGIEVTSIRVLGGPSRNEAWMARKAASSPWPLERVTEPETVAVGAAGIALERIGACRRACLPNESTKVGYDPRHDLVLASFIQAARSSSANVHRVLSEGE